MKGCYVFASSLAHIKNRQLRLDLERELTENSDGRCSSAVIESVVTELGELRSFDPDLWGFCQHMGHVGFRSAVCIFGNICITKLQSVPNCLWETESRLFPDIVSCQESINLVSTALPKTVTWDSASVTFTVSVECSHDKSARTAFF